MSIEQDRIKQTVEQRDKHLIQVTVDISRLLSEANLTEPEKFSILKSVEVFIISDAINKGA